MRLRYHRLKNDPEFKEARRITRRKYRNKKYKLDASFRDKIKEISRERYRNDNEYKENTLKRHKNYWNTNRVFGTCPLCLVENIQLVRDHCHWTGLNRERICRPCNGALGIFKHDPRILRRAAEYVERHYRLHTGRELAETMDANLAPGRTAEELHTVLGYSLLGGGTGTPSLV